MDAILLGFTLALFAGLATTVGAAVIFLFKEIKESHMAFSLAFSTGVMITVSFLELLPEGINVIGYAPALILFFVGALVAFLIDFLIPHDYILERASSNLTYDKRLMKVGLFVALGLAIHNFPEGFAVMAGSLQSFELGIVMALAIAIHNIPEGIAVAVPVFFATKKKGIAFKIAFLSGIAEPIGAIVAALVLLPFLSPQVIGASLAFVAGIMVYICIDELLPTATHHSNGNSHLMTFGFLLGSMVMGATLVLLA